MGIDLSISREKMQGDEIGPLTEKRTIREEEIS